MGNGTFVEFSFKSGARIYSWARQTSAPAPAAACKAPTAALALAESPHIGIFLGDLGSKRNLQRKIHEA